MPTLCEGYQCISEQREGFKAKRLSKFTLHKRKMKDKFNGRTNHWITLQKGTVFELLLLWVPLTFLLMSKYIIMTLQENCYSQRQMWRDELCPEPSSAGITVIQRSCPQQQLAGSTCLLFQLVGPKDKHSATWNFSIGVAVKVCF